MTDTRTVTAAAALDFSVRADGRLVGEHEAAARLGLAVATLRRWRWAGRGPGFIKIGAAVRYDPAVLAAFIEAGCRTSTSDPGP